MASSHFGPLSEHCFLTPSTGGPCGSRNTLHTFNIGQMLKVSNCLKKHGPVNFAYGGRICKTDLAPSPFLRLFWPLELFSENLTFVPSRGTKEGNRTPNGECLYDVNIGLRRGYITTRVKIASRNLGFTQEPSMLGTPALAAGLRGLRSMGVSSNTSAPYGNAVQ